MALNRVGASMDTRWLDLVVFDLDGVLIDSLPAMRVALQHAYECAGGSGDAPFDEFRQHLGKSLKFIFQAIDLPQENVADYEAKADELAPSVPVCAGVHSLLGSLESQSMPMAIATGKRTERAKHVLSCHEIDHHFRVILGSDMVKKPKPSGDSLFHIMDVTGAEPRRTIFIGDAVSDLRCGQEAGVWTGAALWGQSPEADLRAESPDFVFDRPADILNVVNQTPNKTNKQAS